MEVFSASRLSVARERRGLTKKALAEACDVTAPAITQFETNIARPNPDTVKKITKVLRFPMTFFFAEDISEISSDGVSFRSRRSMTAQLRDQTLATGRIASGVIAPRFQYYFKIPVVDIPDLEGEEPEYAAQLVRQAWNLGWRPIGHMIKLLEAKGVQCFWTQLDSTCVDAVSFWRDGQPFMLFNRAKQDGARARFDASHELGHLVLHRHAKTMDSREVESQADRFASAFLMPRPQFYTEAPKVPILTQFLVPGPPEGQSLKERWGVSVQAMVRRCRDMGIYTEWQYEQLFREISYRGYRTNEPIPLNRERSVLQDMIYERLQERGITPSQFASEIHLADEELEDLTPSAKDHSGTRKYHLRMVEGDAKSRAAADIPFELPNTTVGLRIVS